MLLYPSMLAKALCIKNCLLFLLSLLFCYYSNFSKMLGAFPGKIPIFPTSMGQELKGQLKSSGSLLIPLTHVVTQYFHESPFPLFQQ